MTKPTLQELLNKHGNKQPVQQKEQTIPIHNPSIQHNQNHSSAMHQNHNTQNNAHNIHNSSHMPNQYHNQLTNPFSNHTTEPKLIVDSSLIMEVLDRIDSLSIQFDQLKSAISGMDKRFSNELRILQTVVQTKETGIERHLFDIENLEKEIDNRSRKIIMFEQELYMREKEILRKEDEISKRIGGRR